MSADEMSIFLKGFNLQKPSSRHAYISATSGTGITVSGSPEVLDQLIKEEALREFEKLMLPIRGPYHAPHLFDQEDVVNILERCRHTSPSRATVMTATPIPLLSCGTGRPFWATSSLARLEGAISDVLTRPMRVDKMMEHLVSSFNTHGSENVIIVPIGTDAGETVRSHLSSALDNRVVELAPVREVIGQLHSCHGPMGRSKIAVIGMAGRFPGASTPEELWELLQNRTDMCREVPEMRWDTNTHVDMSGKSKNTSKVRWGCWIDDPDLFDASFFAISPREAPQIDPAQRLALMTAYEALEHAGVVPGRTVSTRQDRVGVFYGVTSNDWCESNSGQDVDAYYIPGANRAFIPGRINYFFKFSGPSMAVDTACSSSLAAIHAACNALWQGDIEMAVAGGTNVLTNPDMTTGLDKGHFLSTTGNCKTFDETADGYCRGEGVATVILKRLEDAVEDGDTIHCLLGSTYTNHSAEAESITRPHVGAQRDVFERVLNDSGTAPYDVGYVEMHGTGTQAGDTREINSVCDVLAPLSTKPHRRPSDRPLHLGALKSNIGHGESVSGVSALIKVIMMMRKQEIPPHCGIKTRINPAFPADLAVRNVRIDLESTSWPQFDGMPRKAIINNFSAAGGNTSLLVEEPPRFLTEARPLNSLGDARTTTYPVAVTAKCSKSLRANMEALVAHLSGCQSRLPPLPALSYTTTARRLHYRHRVIVSASTIDGVKSQLAEVLDSQGFAAATRAAPPPPKHVVFAFTGQGSQYPGMGKRLLETLGVFREQILRFDQLVRRFSFPSIMSLFNASRGEEVGDYASTVVQLANTCMQIALARIWISWGISPTAVVGHSLGHYAALNIAGVLSDSDTVYLVGRRAQHLQDMCTPGSHAMLAVFASASEVDQFMRDSSVEVACINGPRETVLAGTVASVADMQRALAASGIRNTLIKVPYAFHSSQIAPIQAAFCQDAQGVVFRKPQIPVLSPLVGDVVRDCGVFGPDYVVRHARMPVNMKGCLESASAEGILSSGAYTIEFGPHPVVSGMVKSTLGPSVTALPTLRRNSDPWDVLLKTLCSLYSAGLSVKWDGYFADRPSARDVVELPSYRWDLKSFWIPYRNDWTLTKGDIPLASPISLLSANKTSIPITPPTPPRIETSSTIHRVLKDVSSSDGYEITTECDMSREDVQPFFKGHKVDGFALCTPAIYADICFSIGSHVLERFRTLFSGQPVVNIADMDITRALIGSADWNQTLRCTVRFDWACREGKALFSVLDKNGASVGQLANCQIKFADTSEQQRLQQSLSSYRGHFDRMRRQCSEGKSCRLSGPMAYRMVATLAEFDPDYHCIDEVLYDSDNYEAVCTVSFNQMKKSGTFYINPGAIDGLTQSGGFVMNANDGTNLNTDVFVNHGWDDFQVFEPIRDDCQYRTHVCMVPGKEEQLWKGDIVIFTDDRAVGLVKGVRIQGLPRRLLRFILTQAAKPPKEPKGKSGVEVCDKTVPVSESPPVSAQGLLPESAFETVGSQAAVSQDLMEGAALTTQPQIISQAATNTITEAPDSAENDDDVDERFSEVLKIISEEAEIDIDQLTDDASLVDLGLDSLLVLMIGSRLREDLDMDIDTSSVLSSLGSIRELRKTLFPYQGTSSCSSSFVSSIDASPSPNEPGLSTPASCPSPTSPAATIPCATSVVLQGSSRTSERVLWFFPDGSGLASSYAPLPRIANDLVVYGLNSPYLKKNTHMDCSWDELVGSFLAEIKRRQPRGPYSFAGWSAGGILGFRAAQMLMDRGELVRDLFLLDSPPPENLQMLPEHFFEYCSSAGLFGGQGAAPEWLIRHFRSINRVLSSYNAMPLTVNTLRKVHILWACESSVNETFHPRPDDPPHMKFLTDKRTDFTAGGWARLFPGIPVQVDRAVGQDHWTLLKDKSAADVAAYMARAMDQP
ncbi:polyketide synthase [Cordyceps javanica]|uniref:Polyketide synthase n=1 Tax=Cordyceps javanica TaxID=43265 RepID=A0A545UPZ2_9HYPO|nr:polyketide synthase [Cordyceps javanica]TQW03681.1 polyketide synthase [Cordyceps javanica]